MTVAMWFKAPTGTYYWNRLFTNNHSTDNLAIVLSNDTAGGVRPGLFLSTDDSNVSQTRILPATTLDLIDGQWHFLYVVRDGDNASNQRLVVDGVDRTGSLLAAISGEYLSITGSTAFLGGASGSSMTAPKLTVIERRYRGWPLQGPPLGSPVVALCLGLVWTLACSTCQAAGPFEASASSTSPGSSPAGALDADRFAVDPAHLWKGGAGEQTWWWQVRFDRPRQPRQVKFLRLFIHQSQGESPVLREVEFYEKPSAAVEFPDWIIVVNTGEGAMSPLNPHLFVNLVRQCEGWQQSLFQQIAHADLDEAFAAAEPRPLCALLTGSGLDWCQVQREPWRGVQEVLKNRNLPIWGAWGGAQILAILEDTGVDRPWDCPRCRDPNAPKLPIYTHIGHTGPAPCGDYTKNLSKKGKFHVRIDCR